MKVLVIGGGGREHAIVDALSRSPQVKKIYCAPGNAGIARLAEIVPLKETDVDALALFAERNDIGLTVVGPEVALAAGIADVFMARGLRIFGPTKAAAMIESSKEFAKDLMAKYGIPTASYRTFEDYAAAAAYVRQQGAPIVLKYDGLAAGKGVVVAMTSEEADEALRDMLLDDRFGRGRVVVEEYLEGPEFSLLCFVSGSDVYPMVLAQDHKRAYEGDKGPNTGGMGAYSPVPIISEQDTEYSLEAIMKPVAAAMVAEGAPFTGVLYGGLMKTSAGIKVIEFNARFGDPETEVVLPRLKSDICEVFCNIADGRPVDLQWHDFATLGIVMASKGYPGDYDKGFEIAGLGNAYLGNVGPDNVVMENDDQKNAGLENAGDPFPYDWVGPVGPGHAVLENSDPENAGLENAGDAFPDDWVGPVGPGHAVLENGDPENAGRENADAVVYHMGTAFRNGKTVSAGGRVLIVVGKGEDLHQARRNALDGVRRIECENLFYRSDIGWQVI